MVSSWTFLHILIHDFIIGFGATVGCHRYWSHKSFKASLPLQILLMALQTAGLQYPILLWCRDHRIHHKFTDTNADPYSASRGFWFSHMTWMFQPRHPDYIKATKITDISDLANDPIVRFQLKYYWELVTIFFSIIPMTSYHIFFPELNLLNILVLNLTRYCYAIHCTSTVNSFAHLWGNKPYDKRTSACENKIVSFLAMGEGWHNYHHTFPWDYRASEFGLKINISTLFINFMAEIGWAWDLKTVEDKVLLQRKMRTGEKIMDEEEQVER